MTLNTISIHRTHEVEDQQFIRNHLAKYNMSRISEDFDTLYEQVSYVLKDEAAQIYGGIIGAVKWNFLKIDLFWVDDQMRGKGYGTKLISVVEKFAKEKKCDFIEVDTFSFQAPEFYIKQGFEVFGSLENAPRGHTHYYLVKKLWLA